MYKRSYLRQQILKFSFLRTIPLTTVSAANMALWSRQLTHGQSIFLASLALAFLAGICTSRRSWFSVRLFMAPFVFAHDLAENIIPLTIWALDTWGMVLIGRALRRAIERRIQRVRYNRRVPCQKNLTRGSMK